MWSSFRLCPTKYLGSNDTKPKFPQGLDQGIFFPFPDACVIKGHICFQTLLMVYMVSANLAVSEELLSIYFRLYMIWIFCRLKTGKGSWTYSSPSGSSNHLARQFSLKQLRTASGRHSGRWPDSFISTIWDLGSGWYTSSLLFVCHQTCPLLGSCLIYVWGETTPPTYPLYRKQI